MVYMLSNKLGGRREVLDTPFYETLGYLIAKFDEDEKQVEKEQMQYYMDFIAMLNSNPQNEKQQKVTEKFMKTIKPQLNKNKSDSGEDVKNKYQWNDRVQEKIEAQKRKQAEKE